MKTYSVIVNETVTYAVELEAQSEDEAIALVNKASCLLTAWTDSVNTLPPTYNFTSQII